MGLTPQGFAGPMHPKEQFEEGGPPQKHSWTSVGVGIQLWRRTGSVRVTVAKLFPLVLSWPAAATADFS